MEGFSISSYFDTITILGVDVSGASVLAVAHLYRGVFPFLKIWSLYPAIVGQAIPSALGRFRLALTELWVEFDAPALAILLKININVDNIATLL